MVWQFKEQPPEPPTGRPAPDAPTQTSLTKNGPLWRPQLTMQVLSRALAAEIEARVAETAEVVECGSNNCPIIAEEAKGTLLFVEGTVQEAVASRSRNGGEVYRLKIDLSATVVRLRQPSLQSLLDQERGGRAGPRRPARQGPRGAHAQGVCPRGR
ncbi:MAG: hypothetical protein NTY77_15010 [Elusimicrobia bacterium]|nr:hypothetical protein [Elusimicrobiota bacterium]